MKLNWGTGIAIICTLFVLFFVVLVGWTFTEDVNLVADNYYEKEIAYQSEIDKIQNALDLPEQPTINIVGEMIEIRFPIILESTDFSGNIHLYRPSDNKNDILVPISLVEQKQFIPTAALIDGLWELKLEWKSNAVAYQQTKRLFIQ